MSIAVVKDKEATVVTDIRSMFPPLCQILRTVFCSPVQNSFVTRGPMQSCTVGALGTIEIMVGLFNIGLGPGRTRTHPEDLTDLSAAYWLGGMFIAVGVMSLLANWCPTGDLVCFAVFMNIVGAIFAIIAIVLYGLDLRDAYIGWMCDRSWPRADVPNDNCMYVAYFAERLQTGMDVSLIVLAVLQLSVCITLAVLGIRALSYRTKDQGVRDVEIYEPVMKNIHMLSPGV